MGDRVVNGSTLPGMPVADPRTRLVTGTLANPRPRSDAEAASGVIHKALLRSN